MPFVKLDTGALDSSLWSEPSDVVKVFFTMLLMCDSEGLCAATAPGIASRANLPLDKAREILEHLESPDLDDRSQVDDGRRIQRVPGGYRLTNYLKYREKDYKANERARRYRERKKLAAASLVDRGRHGVTSMTDPLLGVTVIQAEAEAEAYNSPPAIPLLAKEGRSGGEGPERRGPDKPNLTGAMSTDRRQADEDRAPLPAHPLLRDGGRAKLERDGYGLITRITELKPELEPTEVLVQAAGWSDRQGAFRTKARLETMSDDHLIRTVSDLRAVLAAIPQESPRGKA